MTVVTRLTDAPTQPRVVDQLRILVQRNLRKTLRVPQLLMFSMAMPLAMLILFSQVFRGIADSDGFPTGVAYIDFITPAMLGVSTVMSGTNSGVAIATDASSGVFDRFRTLPMGLPVVYVARALTDMALTAVRVLMLLGAAWLLLGFEFHGNPAEILAVVAVLLPLSLAMSALFLLVGARMRHPEVVQFAGMMLMMPFMFLSSAFAPLDTMPGWLRTAAEINPVTHAIDSARSICLGNPDAGAALAAVASAVILAAVATLATARVARREAA